jgi:hypothetical protein
MKNRVDMNVLPFRTDAGELLRLLDGLARGRSADHVREAGFAARVFEGTIVAASALQFVRPDPLVLTEAGQEYALAASVARSALLRGAMMSFAPYRTLLDEVVGGSLPDETEADWLARWWATRGWGSSESNRAEGVAAFGRLASAAGLAEYVPGRRGYPTRLRWTDDARRIHAVDAGTDMPEDQARPAVGVASMTSPGRTEPGGLEPTAALRARDEALGAVGPPAEGPEQSEVVFALGGGRVARLQVPAALTPAEKQRLLTLIDVLVRTETGLG